MFYTPTAANDMTIELDGTGYYESSSPLEIDLNSLGTGLYFISVQDPNNPLLGIYKILKED